MKAKANNSIAISKRELEIVAKFAGKDFERSNLQQLLWNGSSLCATNGHVAILLHAFNRRDRNGTFTVPLDAVRRAIAVSRNGDDLYINVAAEIVIRDHCRDIVAVVPYTETRDEFPSLEALIPVWSHAAGVTVAHLTPKYFTLPLEVANALDVNYVRVQLGAHAHDALRFDVGADAKAPALATLVVMPRACAQ